MSKLRFDGLHNALIISENIYDCKVLLAAIVEKMTKNFVTSGGRCVIVNMREQGREALHSAADISEDLAAGKRADKYSLYMALSDPRSAPDEAELSLRRGDDYCGRLRLKCAAPDELPDCHIDAVLLPVNSVEEIPFAALPDKAGVVAALKRGRVGGDPEKMRSPKRKRFYCGLYDPCGSVNGVPHRPDCAEPYGVEELFRHLALFAAQSRYDALREVTAECRKTIARRSGVFGRGSIRSFMELERARMDYSEAVRDIYASGQLIRLTEKNPFICGSFGGGEGQ